MSEPVPSITSAPEPLAVDQSRRTRSYLIQMSIRVVCIIGAVMVDGWVRWALVAAAVVLPYSAVLIANSGRDHVTHDTSPVTPPAAPALTELPDASPDVPDAPRTSSAPSAPGAGRVIDHVDD
ncbi:Protein of unknown function (DUF3099) [Promicromonospora umidemergens]|uniref:DUF3099 family protein n=1 Tax=Promicromonospora umidemergens TaxID=629679 RepID=A0ABP8WFC6_9MICO|nr:DUF3099 domain-containing protein [Promicromonospora umidemergens]MCP2284104.1 Protein of unknown function (DUF3099) [Promicromonospora umidemergens]